MNPEAAIRELAAIDRPSASDGERQAAERIGGWLAGTGCQVEVEHELAHGGYWWPIGVPNALSAAGAALALRRRSTPVRAIAAAVAGVAAAALWDDLGHGRRWFRRALLPRRPTWNVIAETGDPRGERTIVLVAHHDAAHSGLVFHPALGQISPRLTPRAHARASHTLPILYGVWLGPVAVGLGALVGSRRVLRAGAALCVGATLAMVDIGARGVVPGANDNLSAVGVLLAVAGALRTRPVEGVRVLLISTGSEESFSEGMQAFGRRHFPELPQEATEFVCLECLGGTTLIVLEGEGMLKMRDYPEPMRDALAAAARAAGVSIVRGLRTVAATDAIIALRAGYSVVTLASVEDTKLPLNYHWPTDVPDTSTGTRSRMRPRSASRSSAPARPRPERADPEPEQADPWRPSQTPHSATPRWPSPPQLDGSSQKRATIKLWRPSHPHPALSGAECGGGGRSARSVSLSLPSALTARS